MKDSIDIREFTKSEKKIISLAIFKKMLKLPNFGNFAFKIHKSLKICSKGNSSYLIYLKNLKQITNCKNY